MRVFQSVYGLCLVILFHSFMDECVFVESLSFFPKINTNSNKNTLHYFAFGSNMLPSTMTSLRNLQPLNASAAVLLDHRLTFDVPGNPLLEPSAASVRPCTTTRNSETTDYQKTTTNSYDNNTVVHGVVYELSLTDFAKVSLSEGVPFAYQWHKCHVVPYRGDNKEAGQQAVVDNMSHEDSIQAYTLYYNNGRPPTDSLPLGTSRRTTNPGLQNDPSMDLGTPPSKSYLNILQRGATYWKMDASYQEFLQNIPFNDKLLNGDGLAGPMLQIAELVNPKSLKVK